MFHVEHAPIEKMTTVLRAVLKQPVDVGIDMLER